MSVTTSCIDCDASATGGARLAHHPECRTGKRQVLFTDAVVGMRVSVSHYKVAGVIFVVDSIVRDDFGSTKGLRLTPEAGGAARYVSIGYVTLAEYAAEFAAQCKAARS